MEMFRNIHVETPSLSSEFLALTSFLVYDYGISHSELILERVLFIHEKVIDARIVKHGPPPTDTQAQRGWYQDGLRHRLDLAAKTGSEKVGRSHLPGLSSWIFLLLQCCRRL